MVVREKSGGKEQAIGSTRLRGERVGASIFPLHRVSSGLLKPGYLRCDPWPLAVAITTSPSAGAF